MKRLNIISGWFIVIMGIIHLSVTPFVLKEANGMEHELLLVFSFMFVATGLAFLYTGYMLLFLQRHFTALGPSATSALLITTILVLVMGVLGVSMMPTNPFTWLTLLTSFVLTFSLIKSRRKTKKQLS